MKRGFYAVAAAVLVVSLSFFNSSCKSCKKDSAADGVKKDTAAVATPPVNTINLPHADTALIPELSKIVEEVLAASARKDYNALADKIVYRGPDSTRYWTTTFNAKNAYEKQVLKITADVLNKWNNKAESRDYPRVFEMDIPDGRKMPVLEVIFVSPKYIHRKFFCFLPLTENNYKIAEIGASL